MGKSMNSLTAVSAFVLGCLSVFAVSASTDSWSLVRVLLVVIVVLVIFRVFFRDRFKIKVRKKKKRKKRS